MVTINLLNISEQKEKILSLLEIKKTQTLFENYAGDIEKYIKGIESILNSIEFKSELIGKDFCMYLEDLNSLTSLNITPINPYEKTFEILRSNDDKQIIKYVYNSFNVLNKDIITSFNYFIMNIASVFENIADLLNQLFLKIVIYAKSNKPLCITFDILKQYWMELDKHELKTLFSINNCLNDTTFEIISTKYLKIITLLRNRIAHGKTELIQNDQGIYIFPEKKLDNKGDFSQLPSSELDVQSFSQRIYYDYKDFIENLLDSIVQKIEDPNIKVPL